MALTPEEIKDITDGLGIGDGKTLAETIAELIDTTLNGYDKRKSKDLEKLLEGVKMPEELLVKLTALAEAKPPKDDDDDDDKKGDEADLSKLPAWARTMIGNFETANKNLQKQFDAEKVARESRDKELENEKASAAERRMYEAAVAAATSRDGGGLDSAKMALLLPYIKEQKLVRLKEGTADQYEMNTGELDTIHNDPVYASLGEGMKKFAGTEIGKTFRAAQRGGTPPGGQQGNQQGNQSGDLRSIESFGGDMKAIREAAEKGEIDLGETT